MKIRSSYAVASVALAMALAAGSAEAGIMLAGTQTAPPFGTKVTVKTTNTNLATVAVQQFSLGADSVVQSIQLYGFSGNGSDINVYIAEALGPDATESNINGIAIDSPIDANAGLASYHLVDIADMALAAGQYYLVVTSSDSSGFEWRRVNQDGAVNGGVGGSATFNAAGNFVNQSYSNLTGTNNSFGFQVFGTPIPAPGAIALAGMSGLLMARRRRG